MQKGQGTAVTAPALLALVGGAMAALGSFLPWASATSGGATLLGVSGFDVTTGKLTFVCGVAAAVVGVLSITGSPFAGGRAAWVAVGAGAAAVALGAVAVADAEGLLLDAAGAAAPAIADQFRLGAATVTQEAGLFVVIAGGSLAVVAGLLMAVRRRSTAALPHRTDEGAA